MAACSDQPSACPFLRSINLATDFSLWGLRSGSKEDSEAKGPMFADEGSFELAFKIFHGDAGVVPLSRELVLPHAVTLQVPSVGSLASARTFEEPRPAPSDVFPPLSFPPSSVFTAAASCPFAIGQCGAGNDIPSEQEVFQAADGRLDVAIGAAPFATIGLSAFGGGGGMFGFDALRDAMEAQKQRENRNAREKSRRDSEHRRQQEQHKQQQQANHDAGSQEGSKPHEALGDDWLATGNCPIARSFRAFNRFLPVMAATFKPPAGVKYVCPPAIVAMRAAVAKHPWMKTLRPQALPIRVLAIGTMGLFLNIPLGAWREHLVKFSPQWILVVHASVPFVAVLRKAALMPKYAMAFTIAASIVGQTIGAKCERRRLRAEAAPKTGKSQGIKGIQRNVGCCYLGAGVHGLGLGTADSGVAYEGQLSSATKSNASLKVQKRSYSPPMAVQQVDSSPSVVTVAA